MSKNYCDIHQKHFGKGFARRGRRRCYECEREKSMRYCEKHKTGLIGDVECDACVYEERDRFHEALRDIATSIVNVENNGACALVDKALRALQSRSVPMTPAPPTARNSAGRMNP